MYRVLRLDDYSGEFLGTTRSLKKANELIDHDVDRLIEDDGIPVTIIIHNFHWEIFKI